MSKYNREYFFIQPNGEIENLPYLKPNSETVDRQFEYESQPFGSAPLKFENANKGEYQKQGL